MVQPDSKQILASKVSQGLTLFRTGDYLGAEAAYRQVLAYSPEHADALHLLGCLYEAQGRTEDAISLVTRATVANPMAYPYFYNLGNLLVKLGRLDEAIQNYQTAVRLKPDYAFALNNLGMALRKQGNRADSRKCFQAAIHFLPGYADAHYNLGLELRAIGELVAAIASYKKAIHLKPDYSDALYALGNAYSLMSRLEDAKEAYGRAIQAQPQSPKALMNLGAVNMRLGCLDEAVSCFEDALRIDPQDAFTHSNLILAASYVSADPAHTYAQSEQWQRIHGAPLEGVGALHANAKDPAKRLRLGYLSADFRSHAAAYWIRPLLAAHQHESFEVVCYSNSEDSDDVTEAIKAHADQWVACANLSDLELAQRIRDDGIDILVDLSGHTDGNRLKVFAMQPAPVQVSWFGLPVSTGLKAIQYRLTDAIIDPPAEADPYYSERLIRLSRFYAAYQPDAATPKPGNSPFKKKNHITFASFNNLAKVTPAMLALWSEILLAVPDSRLLIQAAGVDGVHQSARIRSIFTEQGVGPERLDLRGWSGLAEYLKLGQYADIVLDTFPFNGGVTTCHALWMGLPVVGMSGKSAASRVGLSILSRVGLSELVAENREQYREIAVLLANDREKITALRRCLHARMAEGGLLSGAELAREAEAAYRTMWRTWCATA